MTFGPRCYGERRGRDHNGAFGIRYRYAGKGVWFDGVRQNATLNFGMYSAVQCTVSIAHENTSSGIAASITNIVRLLTFERIISRLKRRTIFFR